MEGDGFAASVSRNLSASLKSVEMWRVGGLTSAGVRDFARIPGLRELDVGWCNSVDSTTGCFIQLAQNCQLLEKLFLTAHREVLDADVNALCELEGLRQLDIMGTRHVTFAAVERLLSKCGKLSLLDIGYCEQMEDPFELLALRRRFPACHIVSPIQ